MNPIASARNFVRTADDLVPSAEPRIAIDERDTHHPFLDRLFFAPESYAFELQINFMIQRVMIVKRWLDAGVNVIMERSHLDDIIFARHLFKSGLISKSEFEIYGELWNQVLRRAPVPDLVICLKVDPEESIRRITLDEQQGHRPEEFPNERVKREWLTSWAHEYRERFAELLEQDQNTGRVLVLDEALPYQDFLADARMNLQRMKEKP